MDHQAPSEEAASVVPGRSHDSDSDSAETAAFGHQADLGILAVVHMMGRERVIEDEGSDKSGGAADVTAAAGGNELHWWGVGSCIA